MKTAKEYREMSLKSIERILSQVNNAHDKIRKGTTSKDVVDRINEEENLFQIQSLLYSFRSRLKQD